MLAGGHGRQSHELENRPHDQDSVVSFGEKKQWGLYREHICCTNDRSVLPLDVQAIKLTKLFTRQYTRPQTRNAEITVLSVLPDVDLILTGQSCSLALVRNTSIWACWNVSAVAGRNAHRHENAMGCRDGNCRKIPTRAMASVQKRGKPE